MKKLILLLTVLFTFSCDKWETVDITVKNRSDIAIYTEVSIVQTSSSLDAYSKPYRITSSELIIIKSREYVELQTTENIGPGREVLQWHSIMVHFFNAIEYDKIVDSDDFDEELRYADPRFYLGHKAYSLKELVDSDWAIIYPFSDPDEESKTEPETGN